LFYCAGTNIQNNEEVAVKLVSAFDQLGFGLCRTLNLTDFVFEIWRGQFVSFIAMSCVKLVSCEISFGMGL